MGNRCRVDAGGVEPLLAELSRLTERTLKVGVDFLDCLGIAAGRSVVDFCGLSSSLLQLLCLRGSLVGVGKETAEKTYQPIDGVADFSEHCPQPVQHWTQHKTNRVRYNTHDIDEPAERLRNAFHKPGKGQQHALPQPAKGHEDFIKRRTETVELPTVGIGQSGSESLNIDGGPLQVAEERQQVRTRTPEQRRRRRGTASRIFDARESRADATVLLVRRQRPQLLGRHANLGQRLLRRLALLVNSEDALLQPPERRTHRVDARAAAASRLFERLDKPERYAELVGDVAKVLDAVLQGGKPVHNTGRGGPETRHACHRERERVRESRDG